MKFIPMILVLFVFIATARAEGSAANATPDPKMEAWIKASTPGEEHQILQRYVGKWSHVIKFWMTPDGPPEKSTGTTVIESMMGGRFIRQSVSGTSMGQPFEGLGITGYDNVLKHFSSVWLDNMGTGMMIGSGTFDKSKNAIVDSGSFTCPMSPSGKRSYRAMWSVPEGNSFKYEMFSTGDDGKEMRMMEIVYSKVL